MSQWKRHVSDQKAAANQANAQLSTGPRTEEGKARSAQNARTHGLSSRELFIRDDEREEWGRFRADYMDDLQPSGAIELAVFAVIVSAAWNLRRVRILEAEAFASCADPFDDQTTAKKLDRLSRYAKRFENSMFRGIRELRTLQTNRAQRASVLSTVRETIPPRADTAKAVLAKRTHPAGAAGSDMDILLASIERETDILAAGSTVIPEEVLSPVAA